MSDLTLVESPAEQELEPADRLKVAVYEAEPAPNLAKRLVQAERITEGLREMVRNLLMAENKDIDEARGDRELLAEKLGRLLSHSTDRGNHKRVLEELSATKRELAALRLRNPLLDENTQLRRRIGELEAQLEGRFDVAAEMAKANEAIRKHDAATAAEVAALERARRRGKEQPDDGGSDAA
jgi:hypothetical protein